ncbi:L,D-transpeptidase family protein [Hufsiella ginkgonis]|uniref:L,D-transpeptidase family protein n=1 Tax=Hufsiella ginkgonis TaxID=2695274 RepID=A0A7K1XVY6_9SPHI|nr:L,D-transpeptidase family protein [Hufsiella ginkgonis]MXV15144.1 L,D-transpeptidase family protein [Hufsiella ginkgonis]
MKRITYSCILLILVGLTLGSCKKPRSDIGAILFKETKNKVFKKVDSVAYYKVFKELLAAEKDNLSNSSLIQEFYTTNGYEPYFIVNFTKDKQLLNVVDHYAQAPAHGLSPELFNHAELAPLVAKLYGKKDIKTVDEAYKVIARTELLTANSLIKYATAMQYGIVNPRKIFARYYMKTAKPDSAFMQKVFAITDIKSFLDTIQPSGDQYKKLQAALASNYIYTGMTAEETKKVIGLNLERLRWKNKPTTDRYVWVNIPDYMLTYVENGKPALTMKVCVGKGPEQSQADADFDESEESVRPHNHTTPQLSSAINNAQVNPVWNIPESIAKNEIYAHVMKDPYYLVNNSINVYTKSGSQVDADDIDWSDVDKNNIPYSFKQAPGDDNSLGKIKFQFPNSSSVYLHDTPAQKPFALPVRAVSHGCVRVEKPLELAHALFGDGEKYNLVKEEMTESNPSARDISLSQPVPVFLDYMTAFADAAGQVQIRPDVYKLDDVLYRRIRKALAYK